MVVKAAIIGLGYMGHFHRDKLKMLDGVELVAVYDQDESKLAEALSLGLKPYSTLDTMLDSPEIDLVLICTPNDVHASLAEAALRHGKHVMCEKPVTMNT